MTLEGNETYIHTANNYVDDDDARDLRANIFAPDTVVFPKVGAAIATNKKRALTVPTIIDNNMVGITVSDAGTCDARFLHNWLESIDLSQVANVSTVPSITGSRLKREPLPLPPLAEQRLIAGGLDGVDSSLGQARAGTRCATVTEGVGVGGAAVGSGAGRVDNDRRMPAYVLPCDCLPYVLGPAHLGGFITKPRSVGSVDFEERI